MVKKIAFLSTSVLFVAFEAYAAFIGNGERTLSDVNSVKERIILAQDEAVTIEPGVGPEEDEEEDDEDEDADSETE